MENTQAADISVEPIKKRYEWIDNARIIAAYLIMFYHIPHFTDFGSLHCGTYVRSLVGDVTFYGRVPFFLILAGYFLARNITWKKAFDRFIWLLVPFVIWNALYSYGVLGRQFSVPGIFTHLLGINQLFIGGQLSLFGSEWPNMPDIGPSWFLRDIMFLSLLTPIIVKFQKWLPLILILLASTMFFNRPPATSVTLAPPTVFFYLLGVSLVKYRISDAYRIFNPKFTPYVVFGAIFSFSLVTVSHFSANSTINSLAFSHYFATLLGMTFGAMMIAHCGVLIENHLPRVSKMMAPCGPACFLVFMLHLPIFAFLKKYVPGMWESLWAILIPLPVFIFIVLIFLLMKRYLPFLMPYLGHMKVTKPASTK